MGILTVKKHLTINQGATYSNTLTINTSNNETLDVTGYSANAMLRRHYTSTNAVTFSCALSNGYVTISLDANTTANLTSSRYIFDVKLTDANGTVSRSHEGQVYVNPSITR